MVAIGVLCYVIMHWDLSCDLSDLDTGPSRCDSTSIIRPCSTLSFPHLTSLESSFLNPTHERPFASTEFGQTTYNLAKSGWEGNFSIDSIKYWYESESPAMIFPINGMNWNEYCRYTLLSQIFILSDIRDYGSLSKEGIRDFSKFQNTNLSTWFQNPVCLTQDGWERSTVSDTECDGV